MSAPLTFSQRARAAYESTTTARAEAAHADKLEREGLARDAIARRLTRDLSPVVPIDPADLLPVDRSAPFAQGWFFEQDEHGGAYQVKIDDTLFVTFAGGALYVVKLCTICKCEWAERCDDNTLVGIGEALAAAHECEEPGKVPVPPTVKPEKPDFRAPRPAFDGGSDSDNLAVIAHNLACIATRLYEFFDCGASMAGRGT